MTEMGRMGRAGKQPHVQVVRRTWQGDQHPAEVRAASCVTGRMDATSGSQEGGERPSRGVHLLVEAEEGRSG